MCVMNFDSHQGVAFIFIDRSLIQQVLLFWRLSVCTRSFDDLKTLLLKQCNSDLKLYEAITSSSLVMQLKLQC